MEREGAEAGEKTFSVMASLHKQQEIHMEHIFLYACIILAFVVVYLPVWQMRGIARRVFHEISEIRNAISQIAESKRFATILTFESKKGDIDIVPKDLVPKKEELRKRLFEAIETENHPNPDTWGYCVLERSGARLFLERDAAQKVQAAFGRLRANGNMKAAKGLATKLVNAL